MSDSVSDGLHFQGNATLALIRLKCRLSPSIRLGISERTVRAHVTALLANLNAADRDQAVARGFELGLLKIGASAGA